MQFLEVSKYLEKLEATTLRNSMVEILSELFAKVPASEIDKITYLMQGRVAPLYVALEFGMADKMMIKAMAKAYGEDGKEILKLFKKIGDLGGVVEQLSQNKGIKGANLSVVDVFNNLKKVAQTNGLGSVDAKTEIISELLKSLDPLSSRFVARIPVGKLRLGFSDMTVLDALSWTLSKSKKERPEIEKVYNFHPDLGFIAKELKENGLKGLTRVKPEVFTPILMAKAERLSSGEEIIEKVGKCAVEPKIDGFRLQAHFDGKNVKLVTRNLEDATFMYPDVIKGIKEQIETKEVIFEGEAIAYNPLTGEFLPFQQTVQRKRKYNIGSVSSAIPLKLIAFDLLYLNGESLINKPYIERRKQLEKIVKKGDVVILSEEKVLEKASDIEMEFQEAVSLGLEGVMAKRLEGVYQAGARSWNWIKYKRSYSGKLEDTIDAVVMGYNSGKGKRTGFGLGAFLIGVYDDRHDMFVTVSKIGTGLTDQEWRDLYERASKIKTDKKPPLYDVDKMLAPDVWVKPLIVVEIRADEITRSPIHTAGRKLKPSKSGEAFNVETPGFALRFPRLERFRDKKPEDATTISEIKEMYKSQRKEK
ncbi:MAG: hypothetical protein A2857_03140 [Candidatus Levybacteria bacterium RIFCSPHIGHO2_01_FULL_36_15]|nr:MAG: hypothetical protein A2857_03140 [Candidatus Levybacteria bacterium RIFCSPHIGHO2_01_FULL_36_15]OGH38244.1 MAG: hypothetical protein A2905_03370 [Candidatus Levybacteria bacterium RIFCSPLOWO2_01_FULL_36_10]